MKVMTQEQENAIVKAAIRHGVTDPDCPDTPARILKWAEGAKEAGVWTPAVHAVLDCLEETP